MKILVTGFDPFGGEQVNPAYQAVQLLPETIAEAKIIKLELPTVFSKSGQVLEESIVKYQPDVVIDVGQAGGRSCIMIEKVAINLAEARIPDNNGEQPVNKPIEPDGNTAYYTNLPIKAMVQNIREHGYPCHISYSAGTYVCNCIMYKLLYMIHKKYPNVKGGFIHVPFSAEQVINKPNGTPWMSVKDMAKCLEYAIEAAINNETDIDIVSGTTH